MRRGIGGLVGAAAIACGCGRVGFEAVDAGACPGVDLETDGANCGACGHDCLGGACQAGACQPVLVADGQGAGRGILVDDTHVYWTAQQAIRRAAKDTLAIETVATFPGTGFRMIAFDGHVYWATRDTGLVARAAMVANANTETIASAQGDVGGLATDGTNVYWNTYPTGGSIFAGTTAGATRVDLLGVPTDNLTGLELVGSTLYFIELGAGLYSVPVGGGSPTLVVPGVGTWEVAIDGQDVFLASAATDQILHTTLAGAPPTVLGPAVNPWGLAVDDTYVYGANEDGDTISRVPRAGGATEVLATSPAPVGITVDAVAVYWSTYAGQVFRLAK